MNRTDFLALHGELCAKMHEICKKKNADYTGAKHGEDAFANFRSVEHLGIASTEQGMLTRMTDKMARLASFVQNGTLQVQDESAEDTLLDLANYSLLMIGFLRSKKATATQHDLHMMQAYGHVPAASGFVSSPIKPMPFPLGAFP